MGVMIAMTSLVYVAVAVAVIVSIVKLRQRSRRRREMPVDTREHEETPVTIERVVIYVLAFASLMAVLFALATLASLAFYPFWPDATKILSPSDAKMTASLSLAALIVGAPIWLGMWTMARQRLARSPLERNTVERRLFLGAGFAVTATVAMFALSGMLCAVFMLAADAGDHNAHLRDLMSTGTRALVYGMAWWYCARLWWKEHDRRALDWTHDAALYVVTGLSAVALLLGLTDAGRELILELQSAYGGTLFDQPTVQTWQAWGTATSEALAGGTVLVAALRYDSLRGKARIMRVISFYALLLFIVPMTIVTGSTVVAQTLQRVFGLQDFSAASNWSFLADTLPWSVTGACFWFATWLLVRREARLEGAPEKAGSIRYPRRLAIAVLDVIGLGMVGFGLVAGGWLVIDAILATHGAVDGGGWWWEMTGWSLSLAAVGAVIWLPAWALLQRAAGRTPDYECTRWERRWLLTGVTLAATLVVIGSSVALIYQILQAILGATNANTLSDALRWSAAAVVAAVIAGYHGRILRTEMRVRAAAPRAVHPRISALIAPGAEHTLSALRQRSGHVIEITGYVTVEDVEPAMHLDELESRLATLGSGGTPTTALLLLRGDGGRLIPYTHSAPPRPSELAHTSESEVAPGHPDHADGSPRSPVEWT